MVDTDATGLREGTPSRAQLGPGDIDIMEGVGVTDDADAIWKVVRELAKDNASLKEKVEILTKVIGNHEHDKRDGSIKFDVGYL